MSIRRILGIVTLFSMLSAHAQTGEILYSPACGHGTFTNGALGVNLAFGIASTGSSKMKGMHFNHIQDGLLSSVWQPKSTSGESVSLKWPVFVEFDTLILRESGRHILAWRIVDDNSGAVLAVGDAIDKKFVLTLNTVRTTGITLMIDAADALPSVSELEVYNSRQPRNFSFIKDSLSSPIAMQSSYPANPRCVAGATFENETVDCGGITVGLSCPDDGEFQPPVFTLKNATLRNVRLAANGGADGIHCVSGDCRLENVVWEDVCEDAATLMDEGKSMVISGGLAFNRSFCSLGDKPDKIFQHNSKNSTIIITDGFTASGEHGKLWRSCGNCTKNGGPRTVEIDNVRIDANMYSIAGANRNYGDKVTIRNLYIRDYSPGLPFICEEYNGVIKGEGKSELFGEFWNTPTCNVHPSDIRPF